MTDTMTVGDRVRLVRGYEVAPEGSQGTVVERHSRGVFSVRWDGIPGAYVHPVSDLAPAPTVEEQLAEHKARIDAQQKATGASVEDTFERLNCIVDDLTSGGPVSCGPLPRGPSTTTPPSCCGVAGLPNAEPDDRVADDLRDLIASQSLAMATARTKQGVGTAAVAILMAAQGDEIGASIARGLKRVLAGFGDLFDGLDLDAIVREAAAQAGLSTPTADPAPKGAEGPELRFSVGVQVDGVTIGTANLPVLAHESEVVEAIRGDAVLMAKIPTGRRVASVEYVPAKVVRITTVPIEAPAPAEAPTAT